MSGPSGINKLYEKIYALRYRKAVKAPSFPDYVLSRLGSFYLQHYKTRDLIQVLAYNKSNSYTGDNPTFEVCGVKSLITGEYSVVPVEELTASISADGSLLTSSRFKNVEIYRIDGVDDEDSAKDPKPRVWTPVKSEDVRLVVRKAKWERNVKAWRELFEYVVLGPMTLKLHEVDRSKIFLLVTPSKEYGSGDLILDHEIDGRRLAFTIQNTWLPQRLPKEQAALLESPAFQRFLELGTLVLLNPNWVKKFTNHELSQDEFVRVDSSNLFTDHSYSIEHFKTTSVALDGGDLVATGEYVASSTIRTAVNKSVDTYTDE